MFDKNFSMSLKLPTPFNEYVRINSEHSFSLQYPMVIWMTGFSSAGKTTLAVALEKEIQKKGFFAIVIDGDDIRSGINKDLGFSNSDRMENIRRAAEIAGLFVSQGLIVICSFITPLKSMRDLACSIIGKQHFIELFVNCPIEICEQRDKKGLYKKARTGQIKEFTGISASYEIPENPDIEIRTDLLGIDKSVDNIVRCILPQISCHKIK